MQTLATSMNDKRCRGVFYDAARPRFFSWQSKNQTRPESSINLASFISSYYWIRPKKCMYMREHFLQIWQD